jgi:hypothetical protein
MFIGVNTRRVQIDLGASRDSFTIDVDCAVSGYFSFSLLVIGTKTSTAVPSQFTNKLVDFHCS